VTQPPATAAAFSPAAVAAVAALLICAGLAAPRNRAVAPGPPAGDP
jgi:hypothetical protein